jgi:hypothetical protein
VKRFFRIFDLSKNEQRVVLIVILALIVGTLVVRYEQRIHVSPIRAAATAESKVSPSPQETEDEQ